MDIKVTNYHGRLDLFLVEKLSISRAKVHHLFENNLVLVNGKDQFKNGLIVKDGDVINVLEEKRSQIIATKLERWDYSLEILYEDEYLLIVNKPSGMVVHPTSFNETNTLINAVAYYLQKDDVGLVHRLDKDSSGIVVIAKDLETLRLMQNLFSNNEITRDYYALVHNCIYQDNFKVSYPIARSYQNKLKMQIRGKNAKPALTYFSLVSNYSKHALVSCSLHTGRTHQIRVHLRAINHPIVNDPLYGIEKQCTEYGQYLFKYHLKFIHPITKKDIEINLDIPNEFKKRIEQYETI